MNFYLHQDGPYWPNYDILSIFPIGPTLEQCVPTSPHDKSPLKDIERSKYKTTFILAVYRQHGIIYHSFRPQFSKRGLSAGIQATQLIINLHMSTPRSRTTRFLLSAAATMVFKASRDWHYKFSHDKGKSIVATACSGTYH